MRSRSSLRIRPLQAAGPRGFTLIEVLVVVAIIALLIAILIPSLSQARERAKRILCASNVHQQCVAMSAYATNHKGFLPWRGWFSYDISEASAEAYPWGGGNKKVLVNLALLVNKYLGNNWELLYCPGTIAKYRDPEFPNLWDTADRFTSGGYNYALPMAQRVGAPRWDMDVYPRDKDKLDNRWLNVLKAAAPPSWIDSNGDVDLAKMMPRRLQVLVMDFIAGGGKTLHPNGLNLSYSDGHARFLKYKLPSGGVSNTESFTVWYQATVRP